MSNKFATKLFSTPKNVRRLCWGCHCKTFELIKTETWAFRIEFLRFTIDRCGFNAKSFVFTIAKLCCECNSFLFYRKPIRPHRDTSLNKQIKSYLENYHEWYIYAILYLALLSMRKNNNVHNKWLEIMATNTRICIIDR